MIDFKNIEYLKTGNPKQQLVYKELTELKIFEKLSRFNPILCGTIPIEIDTENSDLDIICYCEEKEVFEKCLIENFSGFKGFNIHSKTIGKQLTVIARFATSNFDYEIFGQNIPTERQFAYRHMLIESKILEEEGEGFRKEIIRLKKTGMKTEPAFAKLLDLKGDPFEAILKL